MESELSKKPLDERFGKEERRLQPLGSGEVVESEEMIILEDVPIVTPNKDIVASGLTFQVCVYMFVHANCFLAQWEEGFFHLAHDLGLLII